LAAADGTATIATNMSFAGPFSYFFYSHFFALICLLGADTILT